MKSLGLNEIRERYLSFFEGKDHLRLPSFSLVPQNDPSILLINAGMTPMKPYFTGAAVPPSTRITTCQKCIRTPDIDSVGLTARHGTFFEMLGNFSFGDYFKKEMIPWAWEFVTEDLELPPERIHITVYENDDEAYDIWHDEVGIPAERIHRLGKADNFWEHGTGPCGPDSELFFDRGEKYGCGSPDCGVTCECDRFVEFWNLVFTQFDRQADGSYEELEQKNIDTGAGLERVAMIMQDVGSLFEVDTIRSVLDLAGDIAGVAYGDDPKQDVALRVVTDHIRSTTMLIADGVMPSNEGRGYVLRRLLRRAARYGRLLGIKEPFLVRLAEEVIRQSCGAYPELTEHRDYILTVIEKEEANFAATVDKGSALLESLMETAKAKGDKELGGRDVFKLHDTYGFPLDLTREIAAEQGFTVDEAGFREAMNDQRERARQALREKGDAAWGAEKLPQELQDLPATIFTGYERLEDTGEVLGIVRPPEGEGGPVAAETADSGEHVLIILDRTPCYAESGGQVGDHGTILIGEDEAPETEVAITDVELHENNLRLHHGKILRGTLRVGNSVTVRVDRTRRLATARNHTTTHLLHRALIDTLGAHVHQAGSLVTPDRLRFDFSHFEQVTPEELRTVEAAVQQAILADLPVTTEVMSVSEAKAAGAMALFDEKYGEAVRVVSCGDYSMELCGGTHLTRTSQACYFRILSESSVAAGIRRIEAVTGRAAFETAAKEHAVLTESADLLHIGAADIPERIRAMRDEQRRLERTIEEMERERARASASSLDEQAEDYEGVRILAARVDADNMDILRGLADKLRDQLAPSVVALGAVNDDKVQFVVTVSKDLSKVGVHAGKIIRDAAKKVGGGGGGRPDMAQAGGKRPEGMDEALETVRRLARALIDARDAS